MDVLRVVLVVSVYLLTPSTHISIRARVPVMVACACTCTGEVTLEPLAGLQTLTPGELGALHVPVEGMVYVAEACALWENPGAMATASIVSELVTWIGPV